jgi:carboxypeptidase Taq (M32) metallopeptidase
LKFSTDFKSTGSAPAAPAANIPEEQQRLAGGARRRGPTRPGGQLCGASEEIKEGHAIDAQRRARSHGRRQRRRLQDAHWYSDYIGGRFQSYAIGNILSAQFYAAALKAHPDIPWQIADGFDSVKIARNHSLFRSYVGHFESRRGFRIPHRMSFKPERAGSRKRIYSGLPPPCSFITTAVDLSMVRAT